MARRYFDHACDQGSPDAQHNRAFMYSFGLGYDDDFLPLSVEQSNHTQPANLKSGSPPVPVASASADGAQSGAVPPSRTDSPAHLVHPSVEPSAAFIKSRADWSRRHHEMLSNLSGVRDEPQVLIESASLLTQNF